MKKIVFAVSALAVAVLCFFVFRPDSKPMDEESFKNAIMFAVRQRMEADYAPDLLFDDFPASAWLFAQKYGYSVDSDVMLGYDVVLESAKGSFKQESFKVRAGDVVYDIPFPDRVTSRVRYSFYSACPLEVVLRYDGRDRDIVWWTKVFKDMPVAGGSADGRELYGATDRTRIVYRTDGSKVKEIEVAFYSEKRKKADAAAPEILEALKKTKAGDWVLRSQWCVPNSWIERRADFEEFSRLQLRDFSYSLSVPLLKGEMILWNGYFVEGVLYFTYDNWKKASVISKWFEVPEVDFSERRDGDIVEVRISDKLLKDIYLYLQSLMNSNSYDTLRKTILERSMK